LIISSDEATPSDIAPDALSGRLDSGGRSSQNHLVRWSPAANGKYPAQATWKRGLDLNCPRCNSSLTKKRRATIIAASLTEYACPRGDYSVAHSVTHGSVLVGGTLLLIVCVVGLLWPLANRITPYLSAAASRTFSFIVFVGGTFGTMAVGMVLSYHYTDKWLEEKRQEWGYYRAPERMPKNRVLRWFLQEL